MTAGRQFHTQQVHYIFAELEYSDFPTSGSQKVIGTIPAGSIIVGGYANLQTAFAPTSASLPLFVVGDGTTSTQRFLQSTDVGLATTGFYSVTRGQGRATVDLAITAQLSQGALAAMPTTGKIQYVLQYIPPNDNKNLLSTFD
jgi:hypothetical protein